MKTREELNALKEEVETLNKALAKLTKEELEQVSGGTKQESCPKQKWEPDYECFGCEYLYARYCTIFKTTFYWDE